MANGPPSWPPEDQSVLAALCAAHADGSWGRYHGPHCDRLAAMLAQMHGVESAMLCCSGTFAVELALRGLKIGDGDEVILAGYDFSGNFRCVEATGARPVLVDIAPDSWCLDADQLEAAVEPSTRAILVSHLHNSMAPMRVICELASRRGLLVVEDACQSPGAVVDGRIAGSWGDVGVLSFGGSKLLSAGRGGAILTQHADVFQRAKIYCERGNHAFPMSQLQALVLPPQLDKLSERNDQRREGAQRLLGQLSDCTALRSLGAGDAASEPSYYKLAWLHEPQECGGREREQFIDAIQAEGVALDAGFRGFARRGPRRCRKLGTLAHSRRAAESAVLLHHPVLLEPPDVIDRVAEAMRKVVSAFSKLQHP